MQKWVYNYSALWTSNKNKCTSRMHNQNYRNMKLHQVIVLESLHHHWDIVDPGIPSPLASTLLSNPANLDQAIFQLRTDIYGMSKQINSTRTNSSTFEQMISKTNFKINYISMFIWLALALSAFANLGLFIISVIYFLKQRQPRPNPQPNQQPRIPVPQPPN